MALVLNGILEKSREYYRKLKRESVGRLLINPRGSLYRKDEGGSSFVYLRRLESGAKRHIYIGRDDSEYAAVTIHGVALHSKAVSTLRDAKAAMKELGMPSQEIKAEDYFPIVQELFQTLADAGLWDEGVTLVGSWCFKVYQNYCGVEFFPERTLDVDFAVRLPYQGKKVNLGDMLKSLGFEEVINHADGTVFYRSGELSVEFLKDRVGDGRERGSVYEADVGIAPVAVPYMRILLSNPVEIKARDLGRVVVPSMAAFFLHKLLVASERRKDDKRLKDYRQVEAVANGFASFSFLGLLGLTFRLNGGQTVTFGFLHSFRRLALFPLFARPLRGLVGFGLFTGGVLFLADHGKGVLDQVAGPLLTEKGVNG